MSAAKSERVEAAGLEHDFWAIIDEELARMSLPLREVLVLCDLSGRSHLPKGVFASVRPTHACSSGYPRWRGHIIK